jgi:cytochrome c biogenesis protein CcdA
MLAGHTVSYFLAGILVARGIEQISERLAQPQSIDFVISGLVGLGLLVFAFTTKKAGAPTASEPTGVLTPAKCFGLGAVINFIGIPFAFPYFAVVDQIVKADLDIVQSLGVLGAYNALYALPFLFVPAAVAIVGENAGPVLERINTAIARGSDLLMPWMLLLLGLALCADSAAYFIRGAGLWEFG